MKCLNCLKIKKDKKWELTDYCSLECWYNSNLKRIGKRTAYLQEIYGYGE